MKRRHFLKHLGLAASLPWLGRAAWRSSRTPRQKPSRRHAQDSHLQHPRGRGGGRPKAGNGWADRKELCADVMRAQQADLIGLQECQHVHLQHLKARLPEFDSFALSNPERAASSAQRHSLCPRPL